MQGATLVLRDIHQPPSPAWWPPAPGWWLVATLVLLAVLAWAWLARRRRLRRREVVAIFDDALRAASTPPEEIAAMSELLRRAARRRDPTADRLQGEAWLQFLDDAPPPAPPKKAGDSSREVPLEALPETLPEAPLPNRADLRPFSQGPGRLLLEGGYRREIDPASVAELRPLVRARYLQWMAQP